MLAAGDIDGLPYFTMPFVEGESLRTRLGGSGLPIPDVVAILRDVTKALAYAHARNVVHRDIKPDNVLLSGGTAVVTDFGIAKALTVRRAPPERARRSRRSARRSARRRTWRPSRPPATRNIDHRVDLYALGCMAQELLTGKAPFAAIWLLSFGAAFILAKAAIIGIGLPDWVLPGALIVAGLGLPAVIATHYLQRAARTAFTATPTLTPGGSHVPQGTLATMAMRVAPHVTWRRTWRAGAMAAGAFVLLVGAFMSMRAFGIGPPGSLFGKGVLKQNDKIVLAQFVTRGIDSSLGPVLTEALRADLAQSKAISVLLPSTVRDALSRMQRPTETALDAAVGREIAQREGAKLVVASEVARLGEGFVLSAQLREPDRGDPVASVHATAKGPDDLIAAVGRLSRDLRRTIGESLRDVRNSPPLERVSTSSLEAFRKYQAAIAVEYGLGGYPLLLEAVKLDTTFAMAYRKLGTLEADLTSNSNT